MKKTNLYYLSVEGENEKWYFEHLQDLINSSDEARFNVKFSIKIDKSPLSRIKSINVPVAPNQKLPVFHVVDYESNTPEHTKQFESTLDELKDIKRKYKAYNYTLGYTNFAFELWLILHKNTANFSVSDRSRYVEQINALYSTNFSKLKGNKDKDTFRNLLKQISLEDVKLAVRNSSRIRPYQNDIGNSMVEYKGFKYYRENPDITVNECVESVLKECGIKII